MSGFSGVPSGPLLVDDTFSSLPFGSLSYADQVGYTETITVSLSYYPYGIGNYGTSLSNLGSISDPSESGTFNAATDTYTATALVTGSPSPATRVLDQLVYTPPTTAAGTTNSISAEISVVTTDQYGDVVASDSVPETLELATPPSITGTVADQPVLAGNSIDPFASVNVTDGYLGYNPKLSETITITDGDTETDADGILTGPGVSKTGVGTYYLAPGNATDSPSSPSYLNALVFTSTAGISATPVFTLTASDSVTQYTATDDTTSVEIVGGGTPPPPPTPGILNPNQLYVLTAGGETVTAATGDTVVAGTGTDVINAPPGNVFVTGSSGSLVFVGGSASSTVTGGSGSSTIFGGSGGGYYTGGHGGSNILVSQGASGANTSLTGAGSGDEIFGSATGNDHLIGGSGSDTFLGGSGNTTIQGGASSDVIFTSGGATTVYDSTAGKDTVVGGSGSLNVNAQGGDEIFGGSGALNVTGSKSGADSVVGGSGPLVFNGQGSNVLVVGASSTSSITIGNGASLVFAGSGSTSIAGGTGSMTVELGSGSATVKEGKGAAVFQVTSGQGGGTDVLNGFRPGTDQIDLFGYTASQVSMNISGGSTTISLSDGTKIDLVGVTNSGSSIIIA